MLRLLMIATVLLSVYAVAYAQDQERLICPSLRVKAPSEILKPGETARFTVSFDSNRPASNFLKYNWQLSSGKIVSGEGTETIEVEPTIHYVTARVRVTGFRGDNDCGHWVQETVHWDVRPSAEKVRTFTRFDGRTAVPLPNDHRLVIFLGLQKNTSEETARQRETQILEKLDENVDRNQTTIVRVYGGVDITEYWSVPPAAENPKCEGCEPTPKVEKKQECPSISISGPAGPPNRGEPWVFASVIKGTIPNGLDYRWSVPKGSIVEGQGKPVVKVASDPENRTSMTVILEVIGLPNGCPNIASESLIADYFEAILIDEFSAPRSRIEKERFRFAVTEQKNNPSNLLHIIEYFDKNASQFAIREKVRKLSEFLRKELKLNESFFRIVTEKGNKQLTKIYRIPPGATNPTP